MLAKYSKSEGKKLCLRTRNKASWRGMFQNNGYHWSWRGRWVVILGNERGKLLANWSMSAARDLYSRQRAHTPLLALLLALSMSASDQNSDLCNLHVLGVAAQISQIHLCITCWTKMKVVSSKHLKGHLVPRGIDAMWVITRNFVIFLFLDIFGIQWPSLCSICHSLFGSQRLLLFYCF